MSRPLKRRVCVQCKLERPSSVIRIATGAHGKPGVCFVCEPKASMPRELVLARIAEMEARDKAYAEGREYVEAEKKKPKRSAPRMYNDMSREGFGELVDKLVAENEVERRLKAFMASFSSLPRCTCCYTPIDVKLDSNGNPWCPVCAHSVFVCGHCPAHGSPVYFPNLAHVPPPPPHPSLGIPTVIPVSRVDDPEEL